MPPIQDPLIRAVFLMKKAHFTSAVYMVCAVEPGSSPPGAYGILAQLSGVVVH